MFRFLILLLMATPAYGYSVLAPDRVTMEAWDYRFNRDPYFPYNENTAEQWAYGAGMNMDFHLIDTGNFAIYSRNWFHLGATQNQVREAGWQWDNGLRLYNKVELYYGHHSRHILDATPQIDSKYPVYDSFGVRLLIYERKRP